MQHRKKGRKFGRERDQRRALMRSLAASFFMHGRIRTTEAKARAIRPLVEQWITRATKPSLATRRRLSAALPSRVVPKVLAYGKKFSKRSGGYTRLIRLGPRPGDSARMAMIELVEQL